MLYLVCFIIAFYLKSKYPNIDTTYVLTVIVFADKISCVIQRISTNVKTLDKRKETPSKDEDVSLRNKQDLNNIQGIVQNIIIGLTMISVVINFLLPWIIIVCILY